MGVPSSSSLHPGKAAHGPDKVAHVVALGLVAFCLANVQKRAALVNQEVGCGPSAEGRVEWVVHSIAQHPEARCLKAELAARCHCVLRTLRKGRGPRPLETELERPHIRGVRLANVHERPLNRTKTARGATEERRVVSKRRSGRTASCENCQGGAADEFGEAACRDTWAGSRWK